MDGDKKLQWIADSTSNGADTAWTVDTNTLYDNSTGEVNVTVDKVDMTLTVQPVAYNKAYYGILFITDPAGAVPTGLSGASDATLSTWLQTYRRQIWMCEGGFIKFNAALPVEKIPFTADTKRTVVSGQKLVFIVLTRNSASNADTTNYWLDVNIFYHY